MNTIKTPSTPAVFKDFDLSFSKHPITGDVVTVSNTEAIKRSVKHLVLTNFRERSFEPHIGSDVYSMLFEQMNPFTGVVINNYIREVIENFEPRVKLIDVETNPDVDRNSINIRIVYSFQNTPTKIDFNLQLERIR